MHEEKENSIYTSPFSVNSNGNDGSMEISEESSSEAVFNTESDVPPISTSRPGRKQDPPTTSVVLTALESCFNVTRKAILQAEFPIFVHLQFSLLNPERWVTPHLDRLLSVKGMTVAEYEYLSSSSEFI